MGQQCNTHPHCSWLEVPQKQESSLVCPEHTFVPKSFKRNQTGEHTLKPVGFTFRQIQFFLIQVIHLESSSK